MISISTNRLKALVKQGEKNPTIETGRVVEGTKNKNTYFITLQRMLQNVAACFSESKSYLHFESRYV